LIIHVIIITQRRNEPLVPVGHFHRLAAGNNTKMVAIRLPFNVKFNSALTRNLKFE
jgi:hypothetical protein